MTIFKITFYFETDFDNVLEDLITAWINAVNKKFGTDVNPNDIIDWE